MLIGETLIGEALGEYSIYVFEIEVDRFHMNALLPEGKQIRRWGSPRDFVGPGCPGFLSVAAPGFLPHARSAKKAKVDLSEF